MKKPKFDKYEIIGWIGPVAFITAHFLISFGVVKGITDHVALLGGWSQYCGDFAS